ncbi:MAG: response regulator transcription factor [Leptospirales bacterium]
MHKLIIADDHSIFRSGLRKALEEKLDIEVIQELKSTTEVESVLPETDCDGLILDLSMNNINSLYLVKKLKKMKPNLKIIILTMHDSKYFFNQAMADGANGYILKTDEHANIIEAVKKVLNGGSYASKELLDTLLDDMNHGKAGNVGIQVLTPREKEILRMVALGETSNAIGQALDISPRTVENHRNNIRKKLDLVDLADMVKFAKMNELV